MTSETFPDYPLDSYTSIFKDDLLKGRYAFITGGGSGINFRITESFVRHGCNVAIASRNIDRVRIASERLLKKYPNVKCLYYRMDITKASDVISCVDSILGVFPRIDILVNGAAGNFLCKIENMSFNAFKKVFEIATLDFTGILYQAHAGSAKAAINAFTRHCAVEFGKYHINVNSVAPGPIAGTAGLYKLAGFMDEKIKDERLKTIPVRRYGTKKEIADLCVFLCSNMANYITGATIVCDGGKWLTSSNVEDPNKDKMIEEFSKKRRKAKQSKL